MSQVLQEAVVEVGCLFKTFYRISLRTQLLIWAFGDTTLLELKDLLRQALRYHNFDLVALLCHFDLCC